MKLPRIARAMETIIHGGHVINLMTDNKDKYTPGDYYIRFERKPDVIQYKIIMNIKNISADNAWLQFENYETYDEKVQLSEFVGTSLQSCKY